MFFKSSAQRASDARAHNDKAVSLIRQRRYDHAELELDLALKIYPKFPAALANRALCRSNLNRHEEALPDYSAALQLKPDFLNVRVGRGKAYAAIGRHAEALADFNEALRLKPSARPALMARAKTLQALNRTREALDDYLKIIELDPSDAPAFCNAGYCYEELGKLDFAVECYSRSLEIRPALPPPRRFRASIHMRRRNFAQAAVDLTAAIDAKIGIESLPRSLAMRAAAYAQLGQHDLARRDYEHLGKLHHARCAEIKSAGGVFIWGSLVQANSLMFDDGFDDLPGLVAITFDPAVGRDQNFLFELAQTAFRAKGTSPSDPDMAKVAREVQDELFVKDRRRRIPLSLTGGRVCYLADIDIRRFLLRHNRLIERFLPCIAEPGDHGRIELLSYKLLDQKMAPNTP